MKKTPKHGDSGVLPHSMSVGYPCVTLEKHMPCGVIWVLLDVSDKLHYGTPHKVTLVDLVTITDCSHVFLEGQRHPQAGLVRVFNHR